MRNRVVMVVLLILLVALPLLVISSRSQKSVTQYASGGGYPQVQGASLVDGNGNPLLLRGAMIESSFAYIKRWQKGEDPLAILNSTTFDQMKAWGMDALRMNISEWIYQYDATTSAAPSYLNKLDTAIQQANADGLYVILDFHDDGQSGSPYGDTGMLHRESIDWWKMLAQRYLNNPMVLFDPINEPNYPDWCAWQYGGNPQGRCTTSETDTSIYGFQDVIAAIRSVGAKQIIIIEPGGASGSKFSEDGGWQGFDLTWLTDPNIMPSKHDYRWVVAGNQTLWDASWGPMLHNKPLYYGEWAVLPNANYTIHCSSNGITLTSDNADQITQTFLQYMDAGGMNWTAWAFTPVHMIKDQTTYTPTNFQDGAPWSCNSPTSNLAGMGLDVKNFILSHPTPTLTPTLTPTNTPTPTPTFTPTPTPTNTPTPTPTPLPRLGSDTFYRPNQLYWGTSSGGQVWVGQANSSGAFLINKGAGVVTNSGGNNLYDALLGPAVQNEKITFVGSLTAFDQNDTVGALLRYVDANNFYVAYIDGTNLVISKRLGGARSVLGSVPFTAVPNIQYQLQFRVYGTALWASVWPAQLAKPDTWMLKVSDVSLTSGTGGLRSHLSSTASATYYSFQAYGL